MTPLTKNRQKHKRKPKPNLNQLTLILKAARVRALAHIYVRNCNMQSSTVLIILHIIFHSNQFLTLSNPEEDHQRVIAAALRPPSNWRRPTGRPRTTWLRTIGKDLQSQNFGVHTAWRKAKERDTWHQVVSTATLC